MAPVGERLDKDFISYMIQIYMLILLLGALLWLTFKMQASHITHYSDVLHKWVKRRMGTDIDDRCKSIDHIKTAKQCILGHGRESSMPALELLD